MIYDKSHAMPAGFAPLAMSLIITQKRVYEMNERIEKLSDREPDETIKRKIADKEALLTYKFSYLYRSSNDIRQDPEKEPDIDLDKD